MPSDSAGKGRRVTFRMGEADYAELCARCERAGLSRSEYMRLLVRIPVSTEANAGEEHRILFDRKAMWALSRELRKWGYHYNQAVHALNTVKYLIEHGKAGSDVLEGKGPLIEEELAQVNANAEKLRRRACADKLRDARAGQLMPILKPISGHDSTGGIRRYLEKGGRALARDLFNLSYDERQEESLSPDVKARCEWDAEMDATRRAFGTDRPWRGKPARTFKHFALSPDPDDRIDLPALHELACAWALRHFGGHEIAIVYHDDNARGIPHTHIAVNNTDLRTGRRMQTQHPEDLNRDLQGMARERGLSGLSSEMPERQCADSRGACQGRVAAERPCRPEQVLGGPGDLREVRRAQHRRPRPAYGRARAQRQARVRGVPPLGASACT